MQSIKVAAKKLFNASRKPGQVRSKCQFSSADFLTHYEIDVNVNLYQNLSSVTVSNTLAQRSLSSFSNDKYQTSKFKELADDNLKSCKKNGGKFASSGGNVFNKEEIAYNEQFLLIQHVFPKEFKKLQKKWWKIR